MSSPTVAARESRAEITALRACAVLLVVLFHLWPGRLPGGYIGVDVFFVISGFLITSHLLRESDRTGRIGLARFWARRARRLLPAAYLVLAATTIAVVVWLPVSSWQDNFRSVIASTLYVQNWALAADSVDYLAADGDPTAAQHYWSLAIEEQFYLVWPLLILAAAVWARRRMTSPRAVMWWAIGVPTTASLLCSIWMTPANPSAAYFVTLTRAWEFGAGGLVALLLIGRASGTVFPSSWEVVPGVASWAGFVAIAWCGLTYDEQTPFPGSAAFLPVAATAVVIAAAEPRGRLSPTALLRRRPVRFLGDISYSLYLWHWPPIVILPVVLGHGMGLQEKVLVLLGAILAAAMTKRWVEDPVRLTRSTHLRRPLTALVATTAGAAVLVSGAWVARGTAVAEERSQRDVVQAAIQNDVECFGAAAMDPERSCSNPRLRGAMIPAPAAARRDWPRYKGCSPRIGGTELVGCSFGRVDDPDVPHIVVIGDSHAQVLLTALEPLANQGKISLTARFKGACLWTRDTPKLRVKAEIDACQVWKGKLERWLVEQSGSIDLVLTTGYARLNRGTPEQQVESMQAAWKPVAALGVPIVAVRDNPRHPKVKPVACLERATEIRPETCAMKEELVFPDYDAFRGTAGTVRGSRLLDLTRYYCRDGTCPAVIGGVAVYRDHHHLTVTYAKTLSPYLYRELVGMGVLRTTVQSP